MRSATRTRRNGHRIGPKDAGRLMTLEAFERSRAVSGYIYELIDGVLNVSPAPKPRHEVWKVALFHWLTTYSQKSPKAIGFVATDCDIVIPGRPGVTRPRPDVAAYRDFPLDDVMDGTVDWEDLCPILVVEIISRRRPRKDTNRNRQLYWMAGGIAEYWIVDPRKDARRPTMTALRRESGRPEWDEVSVAPGARYEVAALPGVAIEVVQ